ncbi:MAG: hypothetical protein E6J89_09520 [Deltaproteobacteria bacterium]|nr:MAG: hypothetical protein E6J89_09520 [Deltaproteobacteria bacterium]
MLLHGRNMLKTSWSFELILTACVLHGCVAYKFSSHLLPLQENEESRAIFHKLVLGVESTDRSQSYDLEKFMDALKKADLFKEVGYVDRLSSADLILTSFFYKAGDPYRACSLGFEGQMLTIVTIGLIPQICKSESQLSFALYSPKDDQQKKTLSFTYQAHSIFGWAALFYTVSSDWTAKPADEKYLDLLKSVFYRAARDIEKLLQ